MRRALGACAGARVDYSITGAAKSESVGFGSGVAVLAARVKRIERKKSRWQHRNHDQRARATTQSEKWKSVYVVDKSTISNGK